VLHEPTIAGGMGFCGTALPTVLPPGYHGPMILALDSNVLIDLRTYGRTLLDDEPLPAKITDDDDYFTDLLGLATILDLWMLRDIRFIVTPRARTDAKRLTSRFREGIAASIDALAASLAFQFGDWSVAVPTDLPPPPPVGAETGLPAGADKDLVIEAQAVGAHFFLTRDRRILTHTQLTGPPLCVLRPSLLAEELTATGVDHFSGGVCDDEGCPYQGHPFPAPDMGKWGPLLDHLG
jgi:hypothetical protein